MLLLQRQEQGVEVSASFLEAEIIVSCDLYGICQLGEIITPSFSCALQWSHWFSHHTSSCFDSCGRGLAPVSILHTDHKAKGKQQGLNTSVMEDCQDFLSLEIAVLGVKKFYCYHVNMGILWSVNSVIIPAFPLLDLCPSAKPVFWVFHNAAIITVSQHQSKHTVREPAQVTTGIAWERWESQIWWAVLSDITSWRGFSCLPRV